MNGRVVHFEIPADDVARAQSFYQDAFGWTIDAAPGVDYYLVRTTPTADDGAPLESGAINGGMLARQGPITGPVVTIEVDDMAEAMSMVEKFGGKVAIASQPVGDMGFAAYFTDTEGNLIGLWQSTRRRP